MSALLSVNCMKRYQQQLSIFTNITGVVLKQKMSYNMNTESNHTIKRPLNVKMGWSRNVIADLLPFSSELISTKGRPLENIAVGYCIPQPLIHLTNQPAGHVTTQRRVEDSYLEMILPFSDHLSLRESMIRNDGCTVRYGKLFEILDALAADVAYRHCGGGSTGKVYCMNV